MLFAYRGWTAGAPEPVRLVVCNIPDTPGARAHFARVFGGSARDFAQLRGLARDAGVPGADKWTPDDVPARTPETPSSYVVDGLVARASTQGGAVGSIPAGKAARTAVTTPQEVNTLSVDTLPTFCDPTAIEPALGCIVEEEVPPDYSYDGLPPSPEESVVATAPYLGAGDWACAVEVVPPRLAFAGFFSTLIEATHKLTCSGAVASIYINGQLQREVSFFGFFRRWAVIANAQRRGQYGPGSISTVSRAACDWKEGVYRGVSIATTIDPFLPEPVVQPIEGRRVYIQCWY